MRGKASNTFSMSDTIKITERWGSSLSYAGHERFDQEITEEFVFVIYAGIRYKILNVTRKYALLSGIQP